MVSLEGPLAGHAHHPVSSRGEPQSYLSELWSFRELLFFLVWRDIKVRYKQTGLGVLWAVVQPLCTMAIFTVLFGRLANVPTDGIPRPIFYFSALLPWLYISNGVSNASMSLVANNTLLTKIYFPRIMLPAGVVLSGLVDFAIGCCALVGFILYYHLPLGPKALIWPACVALMILLTLSLSTLLSALNVRYRDVKYAVPFVLQLWMFACPIIYPASLVPARFQKLLALNPAGGLIDAFRSCLVPGVPIHWELLGISTLVTAFLLLVAVAYFRGTEQAFADII
ncbi:MAG TPA: ABC transporter permease [Steroidobacteraceae bacterium]|nr:ABC transporter permease [Steroidobacteraceae bacterium]